MKYKKSPKVTITYTKGSGNIVRLKGKFTANGKISLYLENYQGYKKDGDHTTIHRKFEFLKLYLIDKPQTHIERDENNKILRLAQDIRSKRESEVQFKQGGFVEPEKKKSNFFDYCLAYTNNYKKSDVRMIKAAVSNFKEFIDTDYIKSNAIDAALVEEFKNFLIKKYNGETPHSIFKRFKKILKHGTKSGLFSFNPSDDISISIPQGISKEILTPEEVKKIYKTECGNPEVKRAFLFSLNTGLRFVDIVDLKYKHISGNQIRKQQRKTGNEVIIDLNENAVLLLGEAGKSEKAVFSLPSISSCLSTLKTWAKRAGIDKNITWHSARHTFGTMLILRGTDIRTTGSLLGHARLEHTQKYVHIVDKMKRQAVKKLNNLY
ncbi:MAG: site-specific integrase [Bacteroidota bacterium]